MYEEEIRNEYLRWIKDELNNFKDTDEEELPGGVKIALRKLVEMDPFDLRVSSESISDMSQSFFSDDIPQGILRYLNPYRKLKW